MLEVNELAVKFNGQFIFKNATAQFHQGESIALHGASGSGKTSLLRCLVGFCPWHEGQILWNQKPITSWTQHRIRILFLHSAFYGAIKSSILQFLSELALYRELSFDLKEIEFKIQSFLKQLGLNQQLLARSFQDLSSGQRQSLLLTLALAMKPKVLLLDEWTSHMDENLKQRAETLLIDEQKNKNFAVCMTSHDSSQLRRLCSKHYTLLNKTLQAGDE